MSKIIIFDFEVFKYDTLLGTKIIEENSSSYFQTWDLEEIKNFYKKHAKDLWVGHNNINYDNFILQAIMNDEDPYLMSLKIINDTNFNKFTLPLINYDLMNDTHYSLKVSEGLFGKNISESEVSFDIDRKLTAKEKEETEKYNRDDLEQTRLNFLDKTNYGAFKVRCDTISLFNLPFNYFNTTGTKLASQILKAHKIEGIEYKKISHPAYSTLKLNNKELLDFYNNEKYKQKEKIKVTVCGVEHQLGDGGGHGALKKYHTKKALYLDVSGYYNLLMINYDLFPRSMSNESKEIYIDMYHEQLRLKKIDPARRQVLKVILLSVWGAMRNKYTDFYDPEKGSLLTITGQLFLIDLLEKLEPYIILIQTNTDGIIIEPKDWRDEGKIISIVDEWQNRTGFNIKREEIFDIHQRDVNNYMYRDKNGNIEVRGEALKHWDSDKNIFKNRAYDSKEPFIIAKSIVSFFMFNKWPEQTIEENKSNLVMFQQICKKNSYQYLEYEETNIKSGQVITKKVQNVNRVFAYNNKDKIGMIYKHKDSNKKHMKAKVSNLPPSIFIHNNDINENKEAIKSNIDYSYYIDRAYERIGEFVNLNN